MLLLRFLRDVQGDDSLILNERVFNRLIYIDNEILSNDKALIEHVFIIYQNKSLNWRTVLNILNLQTNRGVSYQLHVAMYESNRRVILLLSLIRKLLLAKDSDKQLVFALFYARNWRGENLFQIIIRYRSDICNDYLFYFLAAISTAPNVTLKNQMLDGLRHTANDSKTIFHYIAEYGDSRIIGLMLDIVQGLVIAGNIKPIELVKILSICDTNGKTFLHLMAERQSYSIRLFFYFMHTLVANKYVDANDFIVLFAIRDNQGADVFRLFALYSGITNNVWLYNFIEYLCVESDADAWPILAALKVLREFRQDPLYRISPAHSVINRRIDKLLDKLCMCIDVSIHPASHQREILLIWYARDKKIPAAAYQLYRYYKQFKSHAKARLYFELAVKGGHLDAVLQAVNWVDASLSPAMRHPYLKKYVLNAVRRNLNDAEQIAERVHIIYVALVKKILTPKRAIAALNNFLQILSLLKLPERAAVHVLLAEQYRVVENYQAMQEHLDSIPTHMPTLQPEEQCMVSEYYLYFLNIEVKAVQHYCLAEQQGLAEDNTYSRLMKVLKSQTVEAELALASSQQTIESANVYERRAVTKDGEHCTSKVSAEDTQRDETEYVQVRTLSA